eukprot:Skav207227  [mRNA]  locus=scaffold1717:89644:95447:+ [translate_table: standard]
MAGRADAWSALLERCDVPRVNARGMDWTAFNAAGLRQSPGKKQVLERHGNETFYADNTRGSYAHPKLAEYVLYFGDNVEHSTCSLSNFSLAVGAQGHTESWAPLLRAANRGDLKEVQGLLAARAQLQLVAGPYGHSALHRAALHGHHDVVAQLLRARADPERRDDEGHPATW